VAFEKKDPQRMEIPLEFGPMELIGVVALKRGDTYVAHALRDLSWTEEE